LEAITGVVALLVVLTVGLLITRIATCALTFTGLSRELAQFQARSAFTGCGFTTHEAELIVEHPVRRRIIMLLMLLGNGTVVLAITSLVPVMIGFRDAALVEVAAEEHGLFYRFLTHPLFHRLMWLALGLSVLWMVAKSKWVDRQLSRAITWALKRFTRLEVHDYLGLLHLSEGFTVTELDMKTGDWMVGKSLAELRLGDEGVQVLGLRRSDGEYVGTPTGSTYIRHGDAVIAYGRTDLLMELDRRRADASGDQAHEERIEEQQRLLAEQTLHERTDSRDEQEAGAPTDNGAQTGRAGS